MAYLYVQRVFSLFFVGCNQIVCFLEASISSKISSYRSLKIVVAEPESSPTVPLL